MVIGNRRPGHLIRVAYDLCIAKIMVVNQRMNIQIIKNQEGKSEQYE